MLRLPPRDHLVQALDRHIRARQEPPLIRYMPHDSVELLVNHVLPGISDCERTGLLCVLEGLLQWEPRDRWASNQMLQTFRDELERLGCEWPPDYMRARLPSS